MKKNEERQYHKQYCINRTVNLLIAARVAHPLFMIPFVIIFAGILIWCEKEEQKEINLKTNKENKTTEVS